MYIIIEHEIKFFSGGSEINDIIRKFGDRMKLNESSYSIYNPNCRYVEYEDCTEKNANILKRRLLKSKRLSDVGICFKVSGYV